MQDTGYSPQSAGQRRGPGGRTIAALVAGGLLVGAGGAAWLGWHNGLVSVEMNGAIPQIVPAPSASASPSGAANAPLAVASPVAPAVAEAQLADTGTRIALLEQRLAVINQKATAAAGNAIHAEALLLAFATRRAVERGQPLGWIEAQLRARYGATQGAAVDRIIAASAMPVTLGQLAEQFELLAPALTGGAPDEGTWAWISRQFSELVVIRHDDQPSPTPESRVARVRAFIAGGKVEAALAEVERMPGSAHAAQWVARARDFVETQRALDQLEAAALTGTQPVAGSGGTAGSF